MALLTSAACCSVSCSVLMCTAVRCSALQCVALRCSVLPYVAVCCSLLQCVQSIAVCCSLLQSVAVCCSLLQSVAARVTAAGLLVLVRVCNRHELRGRCVRLGDTEEVRRGDESHVFIHMAHIGDSAQRPVEFEPEFCCEFARLHEKMNASLKPVVALVLSACAAGGYIYVCIYIYIHTYTYI